MFFFPLDSRVFAFIEHKYLGHVTYANYRFVPEGLESVFFCFFFFTASESSLKNVELSEIENLGTKVTVRYGVQLKLLQSSTEGIEDLTYLLKYSKFFLRGQQRSTDVNLRILGDLTDTVLN